MNEPWSKEKKWFLSEVEGLLGMIPFPMLVVSVEGKVLHVNSAAEYVWNCPQITLFQQSLGQLVDSALLLETVRKGKPVRDLAVTIVDQSGKRLSYLCKVHPLYVERVAEGAILQFAKPPAEQEREQKRRNATRYSFDDIRGSSPALLALKEQGRKVAGNDSTVLIRGESGTGKEVLAQAIHSSSERAGGPFIAINCAAIPESLLESELFGYEEGAFTGAKKGGKQGKFELANEGTLFLDEIGDMPPFLQVKLLRVLQERRVERIGGAVSIPVNVRVIAATHKDITEMMMTGQFREDLFFRLNVIPLYVPPLRERKEDLYELILHYMKKFGERFQKPPKRLSTEAFQCLQRYRWPGNIRELENIVEYIVSLETGDLVTVNSLPGSVRERLQEAVEQPELPQQTEGRMPGIDTQMPLEKTEELLIMHALQRFGQTTEGKKRAAESLGISVATLYRRLHKLQRQQKFSK
ncbi:AAA family ATPase [Brevibacillus fluminis]|uniref:AAA family ATPase n=1 Tax=Brevibacillus fluminis TaxID=511487 RepID=A0A3M8DQ85_9BACL|nr:sigma 54-interacting transcriptional regulator [Brevibacillus fluminis]RNB90290.1 AAA family ATPase [Brevibacillus fluminis]